MNDNAKIRRKVAAAYFKLLMWVDWDNEVMVFGLDEGLRKFTSNAFLKLNQAHKYHQGDYYSLKAKKQIELGQLQGLVYEHMIPKKIFQSRCIERAKKEALSVDYVYNALKKYYAIAIITADEDKLLDARNMPEDWDGRDLEARYKKVNITLVSCKNVALPDPPKIGRKRVVKSS